MEMLESAKTKTNIFLHINLYFFFKRLIDIIVSAVLLILLLPLSLFICLRIAKNEGRPIFIKELKVGKNNQTFTMWSFRTMTNGTRVIRQLPPYPFPSSWEKGVPDYFKIKGDKNVTLTETGVWLKRYRFEKIPQLINVFKGEMSLVGPSPERPEIADYYNNQQVERLKVRPGLTGYAQIKGVTNDNHGKKISYDLYYTHNCSYKLDFKIFLKATKQTLKRKSS
ncbi:sugar transferase [Paucisalibacillus globulus]|uniref:sugar transferase n=1 Tax=Paucisalibacillus globulus TaxID=351095 RepID=UPI0004130B47|nr:sugar transferase [Paucisalibacillus globulus]